MNLNVQLGYAEADITPTVPVELVGFDRQDNISRGVLDKLLAQIAIWTGDTGTCCLVTIDTLGLTVGRSNILRNAIAEKLHSTSERVMLCFSHTHSAPHAANEKAYFDFLCKQVLAGVDNAHKTLAPVKAAWGVAEADIGINRRNANGILDRRIGILKVTDAATDKLRLLTLRVTAHANVLTADNFLISSDYFGAARTLLGNTYNCAVMLTQGASGNVRPRYQHSDAVFMEEHSHDTATLEVPPAIAEKHFRESMEALHKMADGINTAVATVIDKLNPGPIYRVDMFSETENFHADVPTAKRAAEIAEEAFIKAGIDGKDWLAQAEQLRRAGISRQDTAIETQYFILNDGCFCGIMNEVMCEVALEASKKANSKFLFFGGYTNGCDGYLPTAEEYDKGGYEVLWSYLVYYKYFDRIMPLNRDTARELAECVAHRLQLNTA